MQLMEKILLVKEVLMVDLENIGDLEKEFQN